MAKAAAKKMAGCQAMSDWQRELQDPMGTWPCLTGVAVVHVDVAEEVVDVEVLLRVVEDIGNEMKIAEELEWQ